MPRSYVIARIIFTIFVVMVIAGFIKYFVTLQYSYTDPEKIEASLSFGNQLIVDKPIQIEAVSTDKFTLLNEDRSDALFSTQDNKDHPLGWNWSNYYHAGPKVLYPGKWILQEGSIYQLWAIDPQGRTVSIQAEYQVWLKFLISVLIGVIGAIPWVIITFGVLRPLSQHEKAISSDPHDFQ